MRQDPAGTLAVVPDGMRAQCAHGTHVAHIQVADGDAGPGPLNGAAAVDGATIGGVSVSVSGDGAAPGSWCFEGEIYSFKVGGRDLAVDNMVFWPPQTKNYETSNRSFIRANRP